MGTGRTFVFVSYFVGGRKKPPHSTILMFIFPLMPELVANGTTRLLMVLQLGCYNL